MALEAERGGSLFLLVGQHQKPIKTHAHTVNKIDTTLLRSACENFSTLGATGNAVPFVHPRIHLPHYSRIPHCATWHRSTQRKNTRSQSLSRTKHTAPKHLLLQTPWLCYRFNMSGPAQPVGQPDCPSAALPGSLRAARSGSRLPFTLGVIEFMHQFFLRGYLK